MNAERWKKIESLFEAASAMAVGARGAFLDRECNGDAALRAEVESLLGVEEDDAGFSKFLEKPAFVIPTPPPMKMIPAVEPGTMIGRRIGSYRITRVIGTGGMGVVFEAEQDSPRRRVALKVLKPSLATPMMVRRFEHEAQILGRLQHPGIAQIYEAGAAPDHENPLGSGVRAFFAMELVNGPMILDFCRERGLSTAQRLELFAKVCDAVQHAHQKGVIHRDLKPANVLVDVGIAAAGDTAFQSAQPKVLDFGVARVTDSDRRVTTMRTSIGVIIGTLPYMSPEQVVGDPRDIDTRSDVYALGVMLYELLAGRLPMDFADRSMPEAARMIRDDEPARLSTINRVFRGDIDTIVSKAIEKNRERRYQSAAELADDLRRHLSGEPIAAKRDSAMYVLRKQIARHRTAAAAAALLVVTMVVFTALTFVQSRENKRLAAERLDAQHRALAALSTAEDQRERADIASRQLREKLEESTIERGRMSGYLGNIVLAEELLWSAFLKNPSSMHSYWALWEYCMREPCEWTIRAHNDVASRVLLSPDERTIHTSSVDGTIAAIDAATHRVVARSPAGVGPVTDLAQHPSGSVLASVGENGLVQFWAARTLEFLGCFSPGRGAGPLYAAAFSTDGSRLAIGCNDGTIRIWEFNERLLIGDPIGEPVVLFGHRRYVKALQFGRRADGREALVSQSQDSTARTWDPTTGETIAVIRLTSPFSSNIVFAPGSESFFLGSADRTVRRFHTETGEVEWASTRLNGTVRSLTLGPRAETIFAGGWYHIEELHTETGEPNERPALRVNRSNSLALSGDGRHLTTATDDGDVKRWEITPTGAPGCLSSWMCGASGQPGAIFSADGASLITGSRAAEFRVWDSATGERRRVVDRLRGQSRSLRLSPDGSTLAVGTEGGRVLLFDAATWTRRAGLYPHRAVIADMAFSPDGSRLYTVGSDGSVAATEVATGACVWWDQSFRSEGLRLALSPDGRTLAVTHRLWSVQMYDAANGQVFAQLPTKSSNWSIAFSVDGRTLFVGNWANEIARWDTENWDELPPMRGHTQTVFALDVGPQGRLIASGSQDTTVRLWDAWTGQPVATLEGGPQEIVGVKFDGSGTRIAVTKSSGAVDVWDLRHYRRHIAGNLRHQLELRRERSDVEMDQRLIDAWLAVEHELSVGDAPLRAAPHAP